MKTKSHIGNTYPPFFGPDGVAFDIPKPKQDFWTWWPILAVAVIALVSGTTFWDWW